MPTPKTATIQLNKNGGNPVAVVNIDEGVRLADIQRSIAGLFADKTALKSVGLKFCEGCKSGLDILIRTKYEAQIDVAIGG